METASSVREGEPDYQKSSRTGASISGTSDIPEKHMPISSHSDSALRPDANAKQDTPIPASAPVAASAPEQMSFFPSEEKKVLSPSSRKQFRIIGQIFETYWIIEYRDALYIIDQHAAHEKVNYERMMKNYREKKINAQMLYPAIVVNLSAKEAGILEKNLDIFASLGFEIESFGGTSFKINSVPDNLYAVASDRLFTEILDQLTEIGDVSPESIPEKIASMSCKAAVKGNSMLSLKEADALIDELLTLENPYNCPHGRPTIIKMTKYDLDRKFKRIV